MIQDTSIAAARSIAHELPRLESQVFGVIRAAGDEGRTCDEIEVLTDLAHQTCSARVNGLRNKSIIADSGKRRTTRSGRKAIVWVIVSLASVLLFLLVGCSSLTVYVPIEPEAGVTTDSAPACTQNGAVACNQYLAAWCARYSRCCSPDGSACNSKCSNLVPGSSTDYNACNLDACKAYAQRIGFDCSAAKYADQTVCASSTKRCVDDLPLMACSDMLSGTSNLPASCLDWHNQF